MHENNDSVVLFKHQDFLGDSGQFVSAECGIHKYYEDEQKTRLEWANPHVSLRISNGQDILDMYLETFDKEDRQKEVEKLTKLIAVLETLKSAIVYADDQMVELDMLIKNNNKRKEEIVTPV